jgi:hypothetical protein
MVSGLELRVMQAAAVELQNSSCRGCWIGVCGTNILRRHMGAISRHRTCVGVCAGTPRWQVYGLVGQIGVFCTARNT